MKTPSFCDIKKHVELYHSPMSDYFTNYCRVQTMIYGTCLECAKTNESFIFGLECVVYHISKFVRMVK